MALSAGDADQVTAVVQKRLELITDPVVLSALRSWLITPQYIQYAWDYGPPGETYPAWLVLEHPPSKSGIAYSEFGFGPKTPWGLIWLAQPASGMDSSWFTSLEDAFCDSFAMGDLRIWDVVKKGGAGSVAEIVAASLTSDEAMEKVNQLNAPWRNNPTMATGHSFYFSEPRTKHRRLDQD